MELSVKSMESWESYTRMNVGHRCSEKIESTHLGNTKVFDGGNGVSCDVPGEIFWMQGVGR